MDESVVSEGETEAEDIGDDDEAMKDASDLDHLLDRMRLSSLKEIFHSRGYHNLASLSMAPNTELLKVRGELTTTFETRKFDRELMVFLARLQIVDEPLTDSDSIDDVDRIEISSGVEIAISKEGLLSILENHSISIEVIDGLLRQDSIGFDHVTHKDLTAIVSKRLLRSKKSHVEALERLCARHGLLTRPVLSRECSHGPIMTRRCEVGRRVSFNDAPEVRHILTESTNENETIYANRSYRSLSIPSISSMIPTAFKNRIGSLSLSRPAGKSTTPSYWR